MVTPSDLHVMDFFRFDLVVNLQFPFKFSKLLKTIRSERDLKSSMSMD